MAYVNYEYYRDTFHGTLSENEFNRYVIIAQSYVDNYTNYSIVFDELDENEKERVMNCLCEVVDGVNGYYATKGISSEHIGDLSVSYISQTTSGVNASINDVIDRWLNGLGLIGDVGWV